MKVIEITSFRAEDRHLSPSNTCDCHVPGEMLAWKMFVLRYACLLLIKDWLYLAQQWSFKGY
jgi:hypothetical protein